MQILRKISCFIFTIQLFLWSFPLLTFAKENSYNSKSLRINNNIFGDYLMPKKILIFNSKGKWVKNNTRDCLSIQKTENDENKIKFSFSLIKTNEHSCEMSGEAILKGTFYQYIPGTADFDKSHEDNCKLEIKINKNTIELNDPELNCRQFSCGVRANIDGATFNRNMKTKAKCSWLH